MWGFGRGIKLATASSMPVGSGRVFMHFSSIIGNVCSLTSKAPPRAGFLVSAFAHTLLIDAWLIPPLHTNAVIIGLGMMRVAEMSEFSTTVKGCTALDPSLYWLLGTSVQNKDRFGFPFFRFIVIFLEQMCQVASTGGKGRKPLPIRTKYVSTHCFSFALNPTGRPRHQFQPFKHSSGVSKALA